MTTKTSQKIQAGMGAIMTAVGVVGIVAPDRLSASSSADKDADESRYQTHLWTLRESALGLILLGTRKSAQRRGILRVVVGLAAAEVILSLRSPALTSQSRVSTAGSAAAFGAAGISALLIE